MLAFSFSCDFQFSGYLPRLFPTMTGVDAALNVHLNVFWSPILADRRTTKTVVLSCFTTAVLLAFSGGRLIQFLLLLWFFCHVSFSILSSFFAARLCFFD